MNFLIGSLVLILQSYTVFPDNHAMINFNLQKADGSSAPITMVVAAPGSSFAKNPKAVVMDITGCTGKILPCMIAGASSYSKLVGNVEQNFFKGIVAQ